MRIALIILASLALQDRAAAQGSTEPKVDASSVMYTIEVRTGAEPAIKSHVVAQFSHETWNAFWDELQVEEQRWQDWRAAVQNAGADIPLLPDFPQISRLAYIDEGTVPFIPEELRDECIGMASVVQSEGSRRLIADLLEATRLALQVANAKLVVHPFGA